MAWSGITEDYTVGWANVTDYFLTNNISGAWIGSFFVNQRQWANLPEHLKAVVMSAIEAGHTYRNQWYWGGEARLRAQGRQAETALDSHRVSGKLWKMLPRSSGMRSLKKANFTPRSSRSSEITMT
jgi:hypothetical protein